MSFALTYHPDVKDHDLPLINNRMKTRIRKAIETRLATEPQSYGEPLRKTLKGYWKLRVGDYRVVYKISGREVRVLAIMHRKMVYDWVEKRKGA